MTALSDIPLTMTLELSPPVTFDGREFSQLVLREPRTKEVLQADEQLRNGVNAHSLRQRQIHLVSKAAGVPLPVIEQCPISVLLRAMAYLDHFLELGQETGES